MANCHEINNDDLVQQLQSILDKFDQRISEIYGNIDNHQTQFQQPLKPIQDLSTSINRQEFSSDLLKPPSLQQGYSLSNGGDEMEISCSSRFIRTESAHQVFDEMPEPTKSDRKHKEFGIRFWSRLNDSSPINEDSMIENELPKQIDNVQQYYDTFNKFVDQIPLSEEYALKCFIGGLNEDIQNEVKNYQPTTLHLAYCCAKLEELALHSFLKSQPYEVNTMPKVEMELKEEKTDVKVHIGFFGTGTIWDSSINEEKGVEKNHIVKKEKEENCKDWTVDSNEGIKEFLDDDSNENDKDGRNDQVDLDFLNESFGNHQHEDDTLRQNKSVKTEMGDQGVRKEKSGSLFLHDLTVMSKETTELKLQDYVDQSIRIQMVRLMVLVHTRHKWKEKQLLLHMITSAKVVYLVTCFIADQFLKHRYLIKMVFTAGKLIKWVDTGWKLKQKWVKNGSEWRFINEIISEEMEFMMKTHTKFDVWSILAARFAYGAEKNGPVAADCINYNTGLACDVRAVDFLQVKSKQT